MQNHICIASLHITSNDTPSQARRGEALAYVGSKVCKTASLCSWASMHRPLTVQVSPFDFTPHVPPRLLTHIHVISTPRQWKEKRRSPRACEVSEGQQTPRRGIPDHREAVQHLKLLSLRVPCHALAVHIAQILSARNTAIEWKMCRDIMIPQQHYCRAAIMATPLAVIRGPCPSQRCAQQSAKPLAQSLRHSHPRRNARALSSTAVRLATTKREVSQNISCQGMLTSCN